MSKCITHYVIKYLQSFPLPKFFFYNCLNILKTVEIPISKLHVYAFVLLMSRCPEYYVGQVPMWSSPSPHFVMFKYNLNTVDIPTPKQYIFAALNMIAMGSSPLTFYHRSNILNRIEIPAPKSYLLSLLCPNALL